MSAGASADPAPVFLFGTGRCGSTHLQRLICLNTRVWVWGEHDGFLAPLMRGLKEYEGSALMKRMVFDSPVPTDDAALVERMRAESGLLSWLNRLDRGSLRDALRTLIEVMFRARLPNGWTGWGFKEIRYGGPDDVPALLLDLFPHARAAFSFREPAATIASMIGTWSPALVREPEKVGEIPPAYEYYANKWLVMMRYFMELKRARPHRLVLLEAGFLAAPTARILEALRVPQGGGDTAASLPFTNRGPRQRCAQADQMLAACFERWRDEMTEIYQGACGLAEQLR